VGQNGEKLKTLVSSALLVSRRRGNSRQRSVYFQMTQTPRSTTAFCKQFSTDRMLNSVSLAECSQQYYRSSLVFNSRTQRTASLHNSREKCSFAKREDNECMVLKSSSMSRPFVWSHHPASRVPSLSAAECSSWIYVEPRPASEAPSSWLHGSSPSTYTSTTHTPCVLHVIHLN